MSETATNERIRCGRGGHYHESTGDVRRCYNGEDVATYDRRTDANPVPSGTSILEEGLASPAQIRFVKDLLNKKLFRYQPGLGTLGCRSISPVINDLKYDRTDGRFAVVERPAYCRIPECQDAPDWHYKLAGRAHYVCDSHSAGVRNAKLTRINDRMHKYGTAHIEKQTAEEEMVEVPGLSGVWVPKNPVPEFDPETLEDGFYAKPTGNEIDSYEVYKVIVAVHGTGRKYAKRLNMTTGEWEMARGSVRTLRPEMRMNLKQALAVAKSVATNVEGRLYGRCFVCGRTLTREDSIERMMGTTCAGYFE